MAMTLLTTNPDSTDVASVEFTSGIDNTYKLYIFKLININPADDYPSLGFQFNIDGGSGYNETITSTWFQSYHYENDSSAALTYSTDRDQAQGTAYQVFASDMGNGADESGSGELFLFNPSNTTYVTHFYGRMNSYDGSNLLKDQFVAGYVNATEAITGIDFKMSAGNLDGVIKMYGVG